MTEADEATWREKLAGYSPLELVQLAQSLTRNPVATWAMEELDRQLVARGCVPPMSAGPAAAEL